MQPELKAAIPADTLQKFNTLEAQLSKLVRDGLVVAFSGGVDSAFLLWAANRVARATNGRVLALTAVSASMAQAERADAEAFSKLLGVEHLWQQSSEVEKPEYTVNDSSRCYHCKSELFRIGGEVAKRDGFKWLAYGYNASDRGDVRPGHKAALENGVFSPLADAELAKDDIRILMRAHALPLSEKPASPCLSSRLMTGVVVTSERLAHIDALEAMLRAEGLRVFRVRMHETNGKNWLRLEAAPDELERAFELKDKLAEAARSLGYMWAAVDLNGYRMGGGNDSTSISVDLTGNFEIEFSEELK